MSLAKARGRLPVLKFLKTSEYVYVLIIHIRCVYIYISSVALDSPCLAPVTMEEYFRSGGSSDKQQQLQQK